MHLLTIRTKVGFLTLLAPLFFCAALSGCASAEVDGGGSNGDGDSDSDTDDSDDGTDSSDSDSDSESESETGGDTDSSTGNGEPELCNNEDDDEDGQTDEDIVGGEDVYEPNQACAGPEDLGTHHEDSSTQILTANIYPDLDYDFFRIYFEEADHTCVPLTSQDFYAGITLVPPQGDDCVDMDLYVYDDSCALVGYSTNTSCTTDSLEIHWEGTCTIDDSIHLRVEVRPKSGVVECTDYSLQLDMWDD